MQLLFLAFSSNILRKRELVRVLLQDKKKAKLKWKTVLGNSRVFILRCLLTHLLKEFEMYWVW